MLMISKRELVSLDVGVNPLRNILVWWGIVVNVCTGLKEFDNDKTLAELFDLLLSVSHSTNSLRRLDAQIATIQSKLLHHNITNSQMYFSIPLAALIVFGIYLFHQ